MLPVEDGSDSLLRLIDVRVHGRSIHLVFAWMAKAIQLIVLPRSMLGERCLNRRHLELVCSFELHVLSL